MLWSFFIVSFCLVFSNFSLLISDFVKMVVTNNIANLRKYPNDPAPKKLIGGPALSEDVGKQETQLLFGERILVDKKSLKFDWVKTSSIDQECFRKGLVVGYPGYIRKDFVNKVNVFPNYNAVTVKAKINLYKEPNLKSKTLKTISIGSMLEIDKLGANRKWYKVFLFEQGGYFVKSDDVYRFTKDLLETENELRNKVVNLAGSLCGTPYVWGGMSGYDSKCKNVFTGLDCSGLVHIIFRCCGLKICRDAQDQFLASEKIKFGENLKPGDLIFLKKINSGRIFHVMIYIGNGFIIHADGIGSFSKISRVKDRWSACVKKIKDKDFFGELISEISYGDIIKGRYSVLFGSYFVNIDRLRQLRQSMFF